MFADEALELDFRRMSVSKHAEDARLYLILKSIRVQLLKQWRKGRRIPSSAGSPYMKAPNVWRLRIPPYGTVIYSVLRRTIQILDIL